MTTVHVAIYEITDERDPYHWALWLDSPNGNVILQIQDDKGGVGYYVAESHDAAVTLIESILVDNKSET